MARINDMAAETRFVPELPGSRYLVLSLDADAARSASMDITEVPYIDWLTQGVGEIQFHHGVGTIPGEKGLVVLDTRSPHLNWKATPKGRR